MVVVAGMCGVGGGGGGAAVQVCAPIVQLQISR